LYFFGLLFGFNEVAVCQIPALIQLSWTNVYRFITSPFFHFGILHLLLNMVAFQPLGVYIETYMGTLQFFFLILEFCIGTNTLQFLMAYGLALLGMPQYRLQCTLGFSGVIFGLLVIDCTRRDLGRSVFGFFHVPSKLYPWILLLVLQIIMPNISFLGHLAGILMGFLFVYGLDRYILPSKSFLHKMETSTIMNWIVMRRGYVVNPDNGSLPFRNNESSESKWSLPWPRQGETTAFSGQGHVLGSAPHVSSPSPVPVNGMNLNKEPL